MTVEFIYAEMIFSFDSWWHVVYKNGYNNEGEMISNELFCRCSDEENAKLVVELLNTKA